ncbi:MAG: universal stress protein [Magnetovibrio sp.]|nr:universal stress protein [Magnetovibrio sp.]
MKRFKNILVVYDALPGGEEALHKAITLAKRNDAHLTLLNVVNPAQGWEHLDEQKHLIKRVATGIPLPSDRKNHHVVLGTSIYEILGAADDCKADLIITSDGYVGYYEQLFGLDVTTDVIRKAACPVWVVHARSTSNYHRVVAAVNAGKKDALNCPTNRRILEMASSLAKMEHAELHVVYAWDFEGQDQNVMANGLSPNEYAERLEMGRLNSLSQVFGLIKHVLDDPTTCIPVVARGEPAETILNYIAENKADILVTDGKVGEPFVSAFTSTTATQFLCKSSCSVIFAKPGPKQQLYELHGAA